MLATILPFPRARRAPAAPAAPALGKVLTGNSTDPRARAMVSAAVKSWMQGDPLTDREQRIVDNLQDANYFDQLGRLVTGA